MTTNFNRIGRNAAIVIANRCGMRNSALFFFKRVHVDNLFGDLTFFNASVRSFDDAELVRTSIERHVENETDVLTFWCVNRTDAAVVRGVHVAHFESCALRYEATAAEC